ncbi:MULTISPECIES: hypothetical protein [Sorangium]|uniref:hypothetical protein n=1 Tax=Sorangium TaxID=39643 RepID=UPI003D9C56CD
MAERGVSGDGWGDEAGAGVTSGSIDSTEMGAGDEIGSAEMGIGVAVGSTEMGTGVAVALKAATAGEACVAGTPG